MPDFLVDEPIKCSTQDKFNRGKFVDAITKLISGKIAQESHPAFTIGLYGKWGEGKSSILNLIEEKLKENVDNKFNLIKFNPWFYTNQQDLTLNFFNSIKESTKEISARNIEKYARLLSFPLEIAAKIADSVTFGAASKGVESIAKYLDNAIQERNEVTSLKDKIEKEITEKGKHFVIFIDDIDRLDDDEIFLMFKLIKQMADFPNTVFVMAMDREKVASALNCRFENDKKFSGLHFLEKIIQAQIIIPAIDKIYLHSLFLDKITALYSDLPENEQNEQNEQLKKEFDEAKEALDTFVMPYISTGRELNQFVNDLSIVFLMLYNEVNLKDLFLLEFLKIYAPSSYEEIRNNKSRIFLDKTSIVEIIKDKDYLSKQREELYSELIEDLDEPKKSAVRKIIKEILFSESSSFPAKKKLLDSEAYFDTYFLYDVPQNTISQKNANKLLLLIRESENYPKIAEKLDNLIEEYGDIQLKRILDEMVEQNNKENIVSRIAIAISLMKVNKERKDFRVYNKGNGGEDWAIYVRNLIRENLIKWKGSEDYGISNPIPDNKWIDRTILQIMDLAETPFTLFLLVEFCETGFAEDYYPFLYKTIKKYQNQYQDNSILFLSTICLKHIFLAWDKQNSEELKAFLDKAMPSESFDFYQLIRYVNDNVELYNWMDIEKIKTGLEKQTNRTMYQLPEAGYFRDYYAKTIKKNSEQE